jgi:hypothetical protein
MKCLPVIVLLLTASPATAQTPLYTNADLGKPLVSPIAQPAERALETWLTHTGGVPPPILPLLERDGPAWIEGPSTDWTATLTPTAPLAPDNGVCYGCYGYGMGYGGSYGLGYGGGYGPGYGGSYWPGVVSQGFGPSRRFDGGQIPQRRGGFVGLLPDPPRRRLPNGSVVINPPPAVPLHPLVPNAPVVMPPTAGPRR